MSAYCPTEVRGGGPGGLIIAGLLLFIMVFVSLLAHGPILRPMVESAPLAAVVPIPKVAYEKGGHADARHGIEAQQIRDCLDKNGGAAQIWRKHDKNRFYLLCKLPDGRWGFQEIVQLADKTWREVTAFIPKDGSWSRVIDYLSRSGNKFNGPFPW